MKTRFTTVHDRLLYMLEELHNGKSVWSLLKYFTPSEFEYALDMDPVFLIMLDCTRWEATRAISLVADPRQFKMTITSSVRVDADGAHGEKPCAASDIRCHSSVKRHFIVSAAYTVGFKRVGVRYFDDHNNKANGHIHLDIMDRYDPDKYPPYVMW